MRSEQVQLDDWAWIVLQAVASERGVGISDLISSAVEEKYLQNASEKRTAQERIEAFRSWRAPWSERDDIGDSTEYVRRLGQDDKIERLYSE